MQVLGSNSGKIWRGRQREFFRGLRLMAFFLDWSTDGDRETINSAQV
jgi:hypothetical protein